MSEKCKEEIHNVSDKILQAFIDKLSIEAGYEEITERLKKVIFDKRVSEASIRSALFDEEEC